MATIYQPKRGKPRRSKQRNTSRQGTLATVTATIDTWDARGRGVSRSHQPVLFADGALPGETCRVAITKQKNKSVKARSSVLSRRLNIGLHLFAH